MKCLRFVSPLHHLALHASYISSPWPELTNHRKTKRQLLWHLCSNNQPNICTDDIFAIFQLSILYYTEPIIASFQFDCPWISFEHFMSLLDSVMQKCEWKKQTRSNQQCHIRAFQRVCLCLFLICFSFLLVQLRNELSNKSKHHYLFMGMSVKMCCMCNWHAHIGIFLPRAFPLWGQRTSD